MMILLSCAKTMGRVVSENIPFITQPLYNREAAGIALEMARFTRNELAALLRVNPKIARDNYNFYQEFHSPENSPWPALLSYTGMVFKRLNPGDFTVEEYRYAQEHLRITSFCYGLLRPMDAIKPYRLEGDVKIPEWDGLRLFDFWKVRLTDLFIRQIEEQGGILLNLASAEMRNLFQWERVRESVTVITPEFLSWKNDRLRSIVIYTKMCRGEMARYVVKNRVEEPEALKHFTWEGFEYDNRRSVGNNWVFRP